MRAISDKIREETYKSINIRKCAFMINDKDKSVKLRDEQQKSWEKRKWFKKLEEAMRKVK